MTPTPVQRPGPGTAPGLPQAAAEFRLVVTLIWLDRLLDRFERRVEEAERRRDEDTPAGEPG